ncbi:hypothetical protein [Fictibacillus nanhaiensis]|uniref:hypothetical protein n=1 Tax=Fictibacillus nanhaiensis TaxID=742169 RepID=UPI003C28E195
MKHPLYLLPSDWVSVMTAMDDYRNTLSNVNELNMFDIAYHNLYEQKEHDGMEFTYIIRALEHAKCSDLVLWVSHTMKRHQKINGPRLKGVMLTNKVAIPT